MYSASNRWSNSYSSRVPCSIDVNCTVSIVIPATLRRSRWHTRRMLRPFRQVDVFTAVPYQGNPVAVVLDGEGLSTEEMQRFARWTNLSETTFVVPPTAPEA